MPAVSGQTRVAGLIGYPARYSLSPALHAAAYTHLGIDATYVVFPVLPEAIGDAVKGIRALQLLGVSVTLPHKEAVIPHLAGLSDEARILQAVNTIVPTEEGLIGHNTDGIGFLSSLSEEGFDPTGKMCAVIGAGGAARAIVAALAAAGAAEIVVINRSSDRAKQAADLGGSVARVGGQTAVASAHLVVNATPIGMEASPGIPIDPQLLNSDQFVADTIYSPSKTALLLEAEARGARTMNGLGMLIHQAAEQIRLWTGERPPASVMRDAIRVS